MTRTRELLLIQRGVAPPRLKANYKTVEALRMNKLGGIILEEKKMKGPFF